MGLIDDIVTAAKAQERRIVLSEGEDPRILDGAVRARADAVAQITLIGRQDTIVSGLRARGADPADFAVVDPEADTEASRRAAAAFHELRRHKGVDAEAARRAMTEPLARAAMMVRLGEADGTVGGAANTTAATVRAALQIIGRAEGVKTVSSFFLMLLEETHHPIKGGVVFADCGLIVEPSAEELADIARASALSFRELVGQTPRVAMLSFSTKGSAKHHRADKVIKALELVKGSEPTLDIDGELQFDAAIVPEIAASKAPGSTVAGHANVFVFPNLEAANIGYKIAQRIGRARAFGPILQGLAKPANDLSRGCDADDVYHMIAVTAGQVEG
ncbi:MAG: phosphate acetyltransferase [Pseudomonadota bacterium]